MGKGKPAVTVWICTVTAAAALVTAITVLLTERSTWTFEPFLALGLLALCAAVAHWFPIKSATDGVSYKLTNVFVLAGAIILPPALLALLAMLATAPELWQRRHRPRVLVGWVFNVSQTLLAAQVAGIWARWIGGQN